VIALPFGRHPDNLRTGIDFRGNLFANRRCSGSMASPLRLTASRKRLNNGVQSSLG